MIVNVTHFNVAKNGHGLQFPRRICLHTTESSDRQGESGLDDCINVMNYWQRQGKGFGTQLLVNKWGLRARYVFDKRVAWGAAGANEETLHLEIIGRASFTKLYWFTRLTQLRAVAQILATWSQEWDIPLVVSVERGVFTHAMASAAFGKSDHTDPGRGFPLGFVMRLARRRL